MKLVQRNRIIARSFSSFHIVSKGIVLCSRISLKWCQLDRNHTFFKQNVAKKSSKGAIRSRKADWLLITAMLFRLSYWIYGLLAVFGVIKCSNLRKKWCIKTKYSDVHAIRMNLAFFFKIASPLRVKLLPKWYHIAMESDAQWLRVMVKYINSLSTVLKKEKKEEKKAQAALLFADLQRALHASWPSAPKQKSCTPPVSQFSCSLDCSLRERRRPPGETGPVFPVLVFGLRVRGG